MSTINDLNIAGTNVSPKSIDLTEMATKASGAWPKGWYAAEVIEGYTAGGHQFLTENRVSRSGDSFNLQLCFRIKNDAGDERTIFASLNYRAFDFTVERIATIQNLRKEMAGTRGAWPGFKDEQRSSLALGQLGQLQAASGAPLTQREDGGLIAGVFTGRKFFVRLTVNEESGYNEINAFSAYPSGVAPKAAKKS